MSTEHLLLTFGAVIGLAFMAYVLLRVIRSKSFSNSQKLIQSALIVFIPIFGAMFVYAVLRTDAEEPGKVDRDFVAQDRSNGF